MSDGESSVLLMLRVEFVHNNKELQKAGKYIGPVSHTGGTCRYFNT